MRHSSINKKIIILTLAAIAISNNPPAMFWKNKYEKNLIQLHKKRRRGKEKWRWLF